MFCLTHPPEAAPRYTQFPLKTPICKATASQRCPWIKAWSDLPLPVCLNCFRSEFPPLGQDLLPLLMLQDQAAKLFPSLICVTHPLTNSACAGSSYSREGQIRSEMIRADSVWNDPGNSWAFHTRLQARERMGKTPQESRAFQPYVRKNFFLCHVTEEEAQTHYTVIKICLWQRWAKTWSCCRKLAIRTKRSKTLTKKGPKSISHTSRKDAAAAGRGLGSARDSDLQQNICLKSCRFPAPVKISLKRLVVVSRFTFPFFFFSPSS